MNEMKEAVGNWREAKQFSPADENDFLRWLDKADTEEKLFSRLTFWFTFRGQPADQNQRYHLVQERARELRLWNGLELKLRRWQDRVADEYEQIGKEAFAARIGEDYADYINSLTDPEAAPQQAAPEPETAKPAGVQAWSARELSEPGHLRAAGAPHPQEQEPRGQLRQHQRLHRHPGRGGFHHRAGQAEPDGR